MRLNDFLPLDRHHPSLISRKTVYFKRTPLLKKADGSESEEKDKCQSQYQAETAKRQGRGLAAAVMAALVLIGSGTAAWAQTTITVTDTGDSASSVTGGCTLRDAINIAQGGSASVGDSCTRSGSPYTIKLTPFNP